MVLKGNIGELAIQDVLKTHPEIGEILARFHVGCVSCGVGVCLLKDVVAIHSLAKEDEARIERDINELITAKGE